MCNLIRDVVSYCTSASDIGKISVYDEIIIENLKKVRISKNLFLHKISMSEIHSF